LANGDAGVNTEATISSAGVLTNVPAGTHTVSLANQVTGPSNGSGNRATCGSWRSRWASLLGATC